MRKQMIVLVFAMVLLAACQTRVDSTAESTKEILDPTTCLKLADPFKQESCLTTLGKEKGDVALCDKLPAGWHQYRCRYGVLLDPALCEQIPKQLVEATPNPEDLDHAKFQCYYAVALGRNDGELCKKALTDPQECSNGICTVKVYGYGHVVDEHCYLQVAQQTNSTVWCDRINATNLREGCIYKVSRDPSVCEWLNVSIYCYQEFAIRNQDPTLCTKFPAADDRLGCEIAVSKDYARCKEASTEDWRDSCFSQAAMKSRNARWCRSISNSQLRDACKQRVELTS